ncbi:hypothetical protein M3A49_39640 [Paraburkholderia sp. CNPSo 3076]|uniref:hypothetical protein n=1 Tax=Paraburkholderia sp. CNPSo 3076 TaxID=2940936 RepID=UPI00225C0DB1|nr:hypothetical protein [Paraburkholderia sp. CNPSo 3076]MCX5545473.1 hypothetical protein [Paraburkholderia sp. CNPSo 3076]
MSSAPALRTSPDLSTPFSRRFGLRLPLVQGPMAGGPTTPALVSAQRKSSLRSMPNGARFSANYPANSVTTREARGRVRCESATHRRPKLIECLLEPARAKKRVLDARATRKRYRECEGFSYRRDASWCIPGTPALTHQ